MALRKQASASPGIWDRGPGSGFSVFCLLPSFRFLTLDFSHCLAASAPREPIQFRLVPVLSIGVDQNKGVLHCRAALFPSARILRYTSAEHGQSVRPVDP